MVELLDSDTRGVLQLADYAERMGEPLGVEEFDAFAHGPKRRSVSMPATLALLSQHTETETVLAFLNRTKLVERRDGKVYLSRLAKMLLSEARELDARAAEPREVLLAAGDEWATRDIMRAVQQSGPGMLVDPYCREEQLNDIARYTETTRVLIGPSVASENFDLTLARIKPPRRLELRVSVDIHDRHVIPDVGPVLAFGASLNGVGRNKPTIVARLSEAMSGIVRQTYSDLWRKAIIWSAPHDDESDEEPTDS
jgi:hypothetical protein